MKLPEVKPPLHWSKQAIDEAEQIQNNFRFDEPQPPSEAELAARAKDIFRKLDGGKRALLKAAVAENLKNGPFGAKALIDDGPSDRKTMDEWLRDLKDLGLLDKLPRKHNRWFTTRLAEEVAKLV